MIISPIRKPLNVTVLRCYGVTVLQSKSRHFYLNLRFFLEKFGRFRKSSYLFIVDSDKTMTMNKPTPEVYQLSEEDIKLRYITPAITDQGWSVKDIPKEEEEVLRPEELLRQYHEKRTALDAKIDQTLNEIQQMLGIDI